MTVPLIGTPDWQLGFVNAQQLLATAPFATASLIVGIPPNTETLAVYSAEGGVGPLECVGQTTGITYPGVEVIAGFGISALPTFYFDVAGSIDPQVEIAWTGSAPANHWYVYGDTGIHVTADPNLYALISSSGEVDTGFGIQAFGTDGTNTRALRTDRQGVLYSIPSAPDTLTGDHPPNELQHTSFDGVANGGTILAPAGAGMRYRLFSAQAVPDTSTTECAICDLVATNRLVFANTQAASMTYGPSGLPLGTNSTIIASVAGGNMGGVLVYTIETV